MDPSGVFNTVFKPLPYPHAAGLSFLHEKFLRGSCRIKPSVFPCVLCNDCHFFFVLAIDEEKKGLSLCLFLGIATEP